MSTLDPVGTAHDRSGVAGGGETPGRAGDEPRRVGDGRNERPNRRSLTKPLAALFAYYATASVLLGLLVAEVPLAQRVLLSPLPFSSWGVDAAPASVSLPTAPVPPADVLLALVQRGATLLLLLVACLVPVAPVSWVYMLTKRLRYDPSLVQSMFLLPIVVAGILLVVQNSIAVAFGLVGVVAAVRFRNTLADPKDAAYIFLTLGIGLASGVQSVDVAMGMSFVFNVVVLTLWRFNIGSIYRGSYGRTGIFTIGRKEHWLAAGLDPDEEVRTKLKQEPESFDPDGILLVHTSDATAGRRVVEECLSEQARDWVLLDELPRSGRIVTLEYLLRLKRRHTAVELLAELDDRSLEEVAAAEYIPYRAGD